MAGDRLRAAARRRLLTMKRPPQFPTPQASICPSAHYLGGTAAVDGSKNDVHTPDMLLLSAVATYGRQPNTLFSRVQIL